MTQDFNVLLCEPTEMHAMKFESKGVRWQHVTEFGYWFG